MACLSRNEAMPRCSIVTLADSRGIKADLIHAKMKIISLPQQPTNQYHLFHYLLSSHFHCLLTTFTHFNSPTPHQQNQPKQTSKNEGLNHRIHSRPLLRRARHPTNRCPRRRPSPALHLRPDQRYLRRQRRLIRRHQRGSRPSPQHLPLGDQPLERRQADRHIGAEHQPRCAERILHLPGPG